MKTIEQIDQVTTEVENLFQEFLDMPYISNSAVNIGIDHKFFKNKFFQFIFATIQFIVNYLRGKTHKHEDKVEEILHDNGFRKMSLEELGISKEDVENGKKHFNDITEMIEMRTFGEIASPRYVTSKYYIPQPLGTTRSPDFLIVYGGRAYYVECKSCKLDKIMFGNTLPKDGYIYLFSCARYDKTVLFLGDDVMNDNIRKKYEDFIEHVRILQDEFNEDLLDDETNVHGWTIYWRNNFLQKGKNGVTAWVKHENIEKYIENVLEFIR